jgi:hypothetical protein
MPGRFSRRRLLQGAAALSAYGALGARRPARAAAGERKFLFLFASGGWDSTTVFEPKYDTPDVDMDPDTELTWAGDLYYTGGEPREPVERFFSRWGHRAAIVNGVDVHSVGHESARQFVMTGTSASTFPDWPTAIAAGAQVEYALPHLVFSGPSYPGAYGAVVAQAGGGTLLSLLDASLLGASDRPAPAPTTPADSIVDAFVYSQAAAFAGRHKGLARDRSEALLSSVERSMELEGRLFEAGLSDLGGDLLDQCLRAVEVMRLGLTRCAMVGIPGGWDSHGDNTVQGPQQNDLFLALDELFEHMALTPGSTTQWLIDEVVVVCMSEIGRTPLLNGSGGKDHWPYTSYLVAGSGVRGGQVLGATDEGLISLPIDFASGRASESGDILGCESVGAALLKLAGMDPQAWLPDVQVLEALVG